jgi:ssDNA-binding Zn-finger/Zn-ribbon topoisomerase 1
MKTLDQHNYDKVRANVLCPKCNQEMIYYFSYEIDCRNRHVYCPACGLDGIKK